MSSLAPYVNKKVTILTADGRVLTGTLLGHDQSTNLILGATTERVFALPDATPDELSQEVLHGLYLVRGENVAVCGLVDEDVESQIDWTRVKAEPLGGMKHS